MDNQAQYIFVKPSDRELINAVYRILFRCGINMAKRFLFHWIPPYSKRAIRRDCGSKNVVLVKDEMLNTYTSTFMMKIVAGACLYVGKIATDPEFEGKGIGKSNMQFMEQYAKECGCERVRLDVYVKSHHAVQFYERNGFVIVGTNRSIRFKEYIMEKKL